MLGVKLTLGKQGGKLFSMYELIYFFFFPIPESVMKYVSVIYH